MEFLSVHAVEPKADAMRVGDSSEDGIVIMEQDHNGEEVRRHKITRRPEQRKKDKANASPFQSSSRVRKQPASSPTKPPDPPERQNHGAQLVRRSTRTNHSSINYQDLSDTEDAAPPQTEKLNGVSITNYFGPRGPAPESSTQRRKSGKPSQALLVAAAASPRSGPQIEHHRNVRPKELREKQYPAHDDDCVDVTDSVSETDAPAAGPSNGARHAPKGSRSPEKRARKLSSPPPSGSRSPLKRRPPRAAASGSKHEVHDLCDSAEDIEQFTPTPPVPQERKLDKGKGREVPKGVDLVERTLDPALRRARAPMRDKNGNVPQTPAPKRSKDMIQSSNLGPQTFIAHIHDMLINDKNHTQPVRADRFRVTKDGKISIFQPDSSIYCTFGIDKIAEMKFCRSPEAPFCQFTANLDDDQLRMFQQTFLNHPHKLARPDVVPTLLESLRPSRVAPRPKPEPRKREPPPTALSWSPYDSVNATASSSRAARPRIWQRDDNAQRKLDFDKPGVSGVEETAAPEKVAARRSRRIKDTNTVDGDNDIQSIRRRSPRPDRNDLLFPYPLEGRADIWIPKDAKYRLKDGDFLNDVFLEFGLKYVIASSKFQSAVHLFSSYFYERLSIKDHRKQKVTDDWPAYEAVQKWTKKADAFSKQFLILPINESLHWYLAVIYNPSNCLKKNAVGPLSSTTPRPDGEASSRSRSATAVPDPPREYIVSDDEDDEAQVDHVGEKVSELEISPKKDSAKSSPMTVSPKPIDSPMFAMFSEQVKQDAKMPEAAEEPQTATAPSDAKSQGYREDYDITGTKDKTYIMTFDSLGSAHRAVGNNLKRWLIFEARDKLGEEVEPDNIQYVEAKVPQQPNFSDCGVFLIHYVKTLLANPDEVLKFVGRSPPKANKESSKDEWEKKRNEVWNESATSTLREDWINTIDEMTAMFNSLRDVRTEGGTQGGEGADGSQASIVVATTQPEKPPMDDSRPPPPDENPPTGTTNQRPAPPPFRNYEMTFDRTILSPSPAPENDDAASQSGRSAADDGSRSSNSSERDTPDDTRAVLVPASSGQDELVPPPSEHDELDSDAPVSDPGDQVLEDINLAPTAVNADESEMDVDDPASPPILSRFPQIGHDEYHNRARSDNKPTSTSKPRGSSPPNHPVYKSGWKPGSSTYRQTKLFEKPQPDTSAVSESPAARERVHLSSSRPPIRGQPPSYTHDNDPGSSSLPYSPDSKRQLPQDTNGARRRTPTSPIPVRNRRGTPFAPPGARSDSPDTVVVPAGGSEEEEEEEEEDAPMEEEEEHEVEAPAEEEEEEPEPEPASRQEHQKLHKREAVERQQRKTTRAPAQPAHSPEPDSPSRFTRSHTKADAPQSAAAPAQPTPAKRKKAGRGTSNSGPPRAVAVGNGKRRRTEGHRTSAANAAATAAKSRARNQGHMGTEATPIAIDSSEEE